MSAGRRLIVNADDFGRAPGINRAIVEAHLRGIVTSTTLMVNLPWTAEAVQLARGTPTLDLGLHLSFCYGPPLAGRSSLVGDDGRLQRDMARLAAVATADDLERETHAQLARFVELVGRLPSHLDSHLHVHAWPVAREPVARIAHEHGLPVRPATPELARYLRSAGVRTPQHFINSFFAPGQMTLERLLTELDALPVGTSELMCHPGYDDAALADSSFRAEREAELALLYSPAVRAAVEARGIGLVTYSAVLRMNATADLIPC